jgi:hypothetical protein
VSHDFALHATERHWRLLRQSQGVIFASEYD